MTALAAGREVAGGNDAEETRGEGRGEREAGVGGSRGVVIGRKGVGQKQNASLPDRPPAYQPCLLHDASQYSSDR